LIDGVSSGSITLSTDSCANDVKLKHANTKSTVKESNKHQIRYDEDLKWSKRLSTVKTKFSINVARIINFHNLR
jgi:hypothetical protein